MDVSRAQRLQQELDPSSVMLSRVQFMQYIAALSALFQDEMNKVVPGPNNRCGSQLVVVVVVVVVVVCCR